MRISSIKKRGKGKTNDEEEKINKLLR